MNQFNNYNMKKITLIVFIAFLLFYSCEKDNTPSSNDLLQGRWRFIFIGDGNNLIPYEMPIIFEYYEDSLYKEFDIELDQYTFYAKYTIDKDLLTHFYYYPEDTLIFKYKYEFYDNNCKLKRIHQNFITTFNTDVLERIQ